MWNIVNLVLYIFNNDLVYKELPLLPCVNAAYTGCQSWRDEPKQGLMMLGRLIRAM